MTRPAVAWDESHQARTLALNVGGRYATLAIELLLGLVMLPFNTRYLGASDYGLWMLAASIVAYFPALDLGYGGAMERFVAHYRARRDAGAINEIASTLAFVFATLGLVAFVIAGGIAWNLGSMFGLPPAQAGTGGIVLALVAAQISLGLPFSVFGAVVNGFQRTYLNSVVGTVVALAVAAVNIGVLMAGGELVTLVAATTATRIIGYFAYRLNAYRVYPLLRIRPSLFRKARLREVTGFSVYVLIHDASNKINYASDPIVIAAVLSTGAVAVWTVAQRLAELVLRLTNQLGLVLFPIVVDCDSAQRHDRLKELLVHGTRLSLATVLPAAGALALMADELVVGWTGTEFAAAAAVLEILALVVVVRVGGWTASTVLLGGGQIRLVSISNLIGSMTNVALSIVLVQTHGLPGVAFATLIPASIRAAAIVVPLSCARVGISIGQFFMTAVWPAAWPAGVVLLALAMAPPPPASLMQVFLRGIVVAFTYALLFGGVAIGRKDRGRYVGKLKSVAGWPALSAAA